MSVVLRPSGHVVNLDADGAVREKPSREIKDSQMSFLTLVHVPFSRSTRILWLLEEIGCPYRLKVASRPRTLLAALHPPCTPSLHNGEFMMHETGAMAEWICETRAPHFWRAPGEAGRPGWLDWLHFGETLLRPVAALAQPGSVDHLHAARDLLEKWLGRSDWLLSEFSGVDCQIGWSIWLAARVCPLDDWPNVQAYLTRCRARPAFQSEIRPSALCATVPDNVNSSRWPAVRD